MGQNTLCVDLTQQLGLMVLTQTVGLIICENNLHCWVKSYPNIGLFQVSLVLSKLIIIIKWHMKTHITKGASQTFYKRSN